MAYALVAKSRIDRRASAITAAAAAATVVLLVSAPMTARGGIAFDNSSTSKWTFAADLNTLAQVQSQYVNPPPASGSMPAPPSYQLNKSFSSGSASALGKGSIGRVTNSTTASFTLAAGSGASQTDPSNIYTGATSLKCDFNGKFNPTSPSFGPPATGYVSVTVGGNVGSSGSTRFIAQVQFLNANTNATLRSNVTFDQTFSTAGPFSKTFLSSVTLSPSTIPVGTPVRVKGFFQFLASNHGTPSEIVPIDLEFSAAPPTATWYTDGSGTWNDPANWTPPADADIETDGSIPAVPGAPDHRARFINLFTAPQTIALTAPTQLGTLQVDTASEMTFAGSVANNFVFDVTGGEAVIHVKNTAGGSGVNLDAPVNMLDSLQVATELMEVPIDPDGPGSSIAFNQQVSGPGALIKTGAGSASLNTANAYAGGTQARGGQLHANVPASLSGGSVLADDGQLNYNANGAASAAVVVAAQNNGQVELGVVPGPTDRFGLQDLGAVSGDAADLSALTIGAGGNLEVAPGAMIAHEAFDPGPLNNPQGTFGLPPTLNFGISRSLLDIGPATIAVGDASPSPWIGFGGDRGDRVFGVNEFTTEQQVIIAGNAQLVSLHNALVLNAQLLSAAPGANFTKRGGGIVVINNVSNPYSGTATVESGGLLVNGNLPGVTQMTVLAGGTLGGKGVLGGNVGVNDGGHLAPGSVTEIELAETFTINGNLLLSSGANLDFDLGAAAITAGANIDLVVVNGSLLLDGVLNINALTDFGVGSYPLFETTGPITDMGVLIGIAPDDFLYNVLVQQPAGADPGLVMLEVTLIPEPGTLGAITLALVHFTRRRARRSRAGSSGARGPDSRRAVAAAGTRPAAG